MTKVNEENWQIFINRTTTNEYDNSENSTMHYDSVVQN